MERIKINLPDTFPFSTSITIRITDINYGGHVGNDSFLSLIHEARMQFLNACGYSELTFDRYGLIMADVAIEFKKELYHKDVVSIAVAATGFEKFGFDVCYKLYMNIDDKEVIVGKAKTGMLVFDYDKKKLVPLSEEAKQQLIQPKA